MKIKDKLIILTNLSFIYEETGNTVGYFILMQRFLDLIFDVFYFFDNKLF